MLNIIEKYKYYTILLIPIVIFLIGYSATLQLPNKATVDMMSQHSTCLFGNVEIISLFRTGDILTHISYMITAPLLFLIGVFLNTRWIYKFWFFLTATFVLTCGIGHLWDYLDIYSNYYHYKAINTKITGYISLSVPLLTLFISPLIFSDYTQYKEDMIRLNHLENVNDNMDLKFNKEYKNLYKKVLESLENNDLSKLNDYIK